MSRQRFSLLGLLRGAVVLLVSLMMVAPLVIVLILSFSSAPFLTFPPPGLSLQWYAKFLGDPVWLRTLGTSVLVMLPAAAISTVAGTLAAVALARGSFRLRGVVLGLLMAPLAVPVIITAAGIYGVFRPLGLNGTLAGLVLAHVVLTLPYVLSTVLAALQLVDPALEKAALTLGATPATALRRVTLPLAMPAILSGFLFALVVSFDELVVSLFISTPLVRPVTVQMWSDVRGAVDPTIAAVSTTLFAATLGLMLVEATVRARSRVASRPALFALGAAPGTAP